MSKLLKIYDNIIPVSLQDYYQQFTSNELEEGFPLYYYKGSTFKDKILDEYDFMLGHNLYDIDTKSTATSFTFKFLQILFYLSYHINFFITDVYRMRFFHQPPSIKPITLPPHTDQETPHLSCIYYINDSDGDTIFYNENKEEIKKVSPKKGRIAFFDGSIPHSGSRPSTTHRRLININFNGFFINKN